MDYSYYYEAARQALDLHASSSTHREHGLAEGASVQAPARGIERRPLPRLAGQARGVRVHLRARAGARVLLDLGRARRADAHRALAPVQGVRAPPGRGRRAAAEELPAPQGVQVHRRASARSVSRATTTTARATRVYDTDDARVRVQARRVRHRDRGDEDLRGATSSGTSATGCSSASSRRARAPRAPRSGRDLRPADEPCKAGAVGEGVERRGLHLADVRDARGERRRKREASAASSARASIVTGDGAGRAPVRALATPSAFRCAPRARGVSRARPRSRTRGRSRCGGPG